MTKQTTKRVWQVAKELGVSSKDIMKLSNKHHWFCNITDDEIKEVKNKLNKQGGNTMKQRVEIKAEEMMRIFKEGGSFVLTLEGIEIFGVKGNVEYHLNGKKIINTFECEEENVQYFINMVNDECYEGWQVWEIISNPISEFAQWMKEETAEKVNRPIVYEDLSHEEFKLLRPYIYTKLYLSSDEQDVIYSVKNRRPIMKQELEKAIEWAKEAYIKREAKGLKELEGYVSLNNVTEPILIQKNDNGKLVNFAIVSSKCIYQYNKNHKWEKSYINNMAKEIQEITENKEAVSFAYFNMSENVKKSTGIKF